MPAESGRVSELAVTTSTHQVRFGAKFQRRWIRSRIAGMRIMASPAAYFGLLETLRAFQRFNYERCLPKPPVFVKALSGELPEPLPQAVSEELSRGNIIQFTVGPRIADCRLHVALRTNGGRLSAVDLVEIHGRIQRILRMVVMLTHFYNVTTGRTMTHLAIDSRLLEFHVIDVEPPALGIPQPAGMAHRANCLIAGRGVESLPGARVSALASWTVNHFPKIDPPLVQHVILNREYVNFSVRQFRGIRLLKFRAYGVVDRIAVPLAVGLQDVEVVAVFAHRHPGKETLIPVTLQFELSVPIVCFIPEIELIVVLEISDNVLRSVRTKHLCHAAFCPALVNFGMASAAGIGTEIGHRCGLCVAFLVCGFVRILERGLPAAPGVLPEILERSAWFGIQQTI